MSLKKTILVIIGCIALALGALGAVLPILPTIPFLLVSAYCFANSSERLNTWFKNTKLYKNNLEDYVKGNGMTVQTKVKIMVMVTLLMSIGFVLMGRKGIVIGCVVLAVVWLFHIMYFCFGVKTIKKETEI